MYLPVLRFPGPPLQRSEEFPFRVLVETQWKQHETTSQCLVRSKIPSSLAGVEKRPPDSFLKVGKTQTIWSYLLLKGLFLLMFLGFQVSHFDFCKGNSSAFLFLRSRVVRISSKMTSQLVMSFRSFSRIFRLVL